MTAHNVRPKALLLLTAGLSVVFSATLATPAVAHVSAPPASGVAAAPHAPGARVANPVQNSALVSNPAYTGAPQLAAGAPSQRPANCPVPSTKALSTPPASKKKTVALTFDDGPGVSTPEVLRILKNKGVPATFFVTTQRLASNSKYVKQAVKEGHLVQNHTVTHPQLAKLSRAAQRREIRNAGIDIRDTTGVWPCWIRPPYGSYNNITVSVANSHHMSVVTWNVDTVDWKAGSTLNPTVKANILTQVRKSPTNAMVLMHDGPSSRPTTVAALPEVIDWYKNNGYTFVRVDGKTK